MLGALRAATAQRHAVLDAGLPIGRPDATLDDYRHHLLMLRAWLAPLESWLSGFQDGPQVLPAKARVAVIDADLADAGVLQTAGERGDNAGSSVQTWPAAASAAYRWGICYVVEGSQLGGAVLYARLKDSLAPHPLHYLRGEAEGPGPRWRQFMQALKAEVTRSEDIEVACRGACDAFDRILALR